MKKLIEIKKTFRGILIIGALSILIGIGCMIVLSGTIPTNIMAWVMNLGYSLMLGYGLFSNSIVVAIIEDRWLAWAKRPVRSLVIAFLVTTVYSAVVIFFTNWFWYGFILDYSWEKFSSFGKRVLMIEFIVLYIITLFFYARGFLKEWRESLVAEERLRQEAISLQFKVLSNQVNPHFLFNSLNVLSSLIKIDAERAVTFVNKLSQFYRDLLGFKGKEVVLLKEEVEFVNQYLDLQKERFGDNIKIDVTVSDQDRFYVIPMSLQMLVENAIKHNQISSQNKLSIRVFSDNNKYITVENNYQPYLNPVDGEKLGLNNLSDRYRFLTDAPMEINQSDAKFFVKMPLLDMETN